MTRRRRLWCVRESTPISFKGLKLSITSDESKNINFDETPKVIISASGMCDAGRIRHHLKHNLWRPECTVVFAGYQAVGTLGRTLIDGGRTVKLFGEEIEVKAHIEQIEGISGHADRGGLIEWITAFKVKPQKVFLVHGDDAVCDIFCGKSAGKLSPGRPGPFSGSVFDLAAGQWLTVTEGVRIEREEKPAAKKAAGVYARLLAAGERLLTVIRHNEGGANKDLANSPIRSSPSATSGTVKKPYAARPGNMRRAVYSLKISAGFGSGK